MQDLEHQEQCKVITWCKLNENKYIELQNIYSTPNARKCTPRQGAYLNAEGRKKGVFDLCLAWQRLPFAGLYLEMKWGNNTLSHEQKDWRIRFERGGYKTVTCWSFEEAVKEICEYLDIPYKL